MKRLFFFLIAALAGIAPAFSDSKPDFLYSDIVDRLRADCASGTLTQDLNAKDRDGYTALYYAIDNNDLDLVKAFVRNKAKVDLPCDEGGEYPLMVASGFFNREAIARYLVEAGAKVNCADRKKNTPLHVAAQNGRLELVKLYLEKGAKLEAKNADGYTPFLCACDDFSGRDCDKVATRRFLLEKGANAKAVNKYGENAFNVLFTIYEGFGLLYPYYPDSGFLKALVDAGVDINRSGKRFESPLIICVAASAIEIDALPVMNELIALGADIERKDGNGDTPLLYAAANGSLSAFSFLLERGADPATKRADGSTLEGIIEKNRVSKYYGFVYDDMKELLDARVAHDPSGLSVPESARPERKGGKVLYSADVTNIFEILRNVDPDDDTVIKIAKVADPLRYIYLQHYLSMIPSPVTLDLTECDARAMVPQLTLCVPNVTKIVYPEYRPSEGDPADFYAYHVSNFLDLRELSIPEGIRRIQRYSVTRLERLTVIRVPATVTEIEDEAFWGCDNLERVIVKNKNAAIGDKALSRCPKAKIVFE